MVTPIVYRNRTHWVIGTLLAWAVVACVARPAMTMHASALVGSVNTRDFGALCDGVADDRAAIQAAISSGAADVVVQSGTCMVAFGGAGFCDLALPSGITLRGESRDGSILMQAPGQPSSVRLIGVGTCWSGSPTITGVTIRDVTLDGNKSEQSVDEHRSGVFGSNAPGLTIERVTARNFTGDGFYLYNHSDNFAVSDVIAVDNDRDGIVLGGSTIGGMITGSTFTRNKAQQFDTEGGVVTGVTVTGNLIDPAGVSNDYAMTIAGASASARSSGWTISGNTINGGVEFVWTDGMLFTANHGINPTTKPFVTLWRTTNSVTIEGNALTDTQTAVANSSIVYVGGTGTGSASTGTRIAGNTLTVVGMAGSFGVRVEGAISVRIEDNNIVGPGVAALGSAGIYLRATNQAEDFRSAIVRRNTVRNWGALGLTVAGNAAAKLDSLVIAENVFDDTGGTMATAMRLDDGTGAVQAIDMTGNALTGGVTTLCSRYPVGLQVLVAGQRGLPGALMVTP